MKASIWVFQHWFLINGLALNGISWTNVMRRHILLLTLMLFGAVLVSCIGNSTGPLQNQLVGSWRLTEIRNYETGSLYPDWSCVYIYKIDNTYSRWLNDSLAEEGQYSIQTWEEILIVTYKPWNTVWGVWIIGDSMYMGKPKLHGGSTWVFCRVYE